MSMLTKILIKFILFLDFFLINKYEQPIEHNKIAILWSIKSFETTIYALDYLIPYFLVIFPYRILTFSF